MVLSASVVASDWVSLGFRDCVHMLYVVSCVKAVPFHCRVSVLCME